MSSMEDHAFLIQPGSAEAFGALITRWSLEPTSAPAGIMTFAEFAKILDDEGISYSAPSDPDFAFKHVYVYHGMMGRLDVRIPAKQMVEKSEKVIESSGYPIPAYYFEIFPNAEAQVDDWKRLRRQRIADYTISNCA
ncbi:MAG: hypothetical protein AAF763_07690 [Pseudomonadota bacterium]